MADLVKQESSREMFIFAKNSAEMARAQQKTIDGVKAKVAVEQERLADLEKNLEIAKRNKWRTKVLADNVRYAKNRIEFYEKVLAALEAGFQIVPDMDVDVFAIRTAKKPKANTVTRATTSYNDGDVPAAQVSESPPAGSGEYVATGAKYEEERSTKEVQRTVGGATVTEKQELVTRWAVEHGEVEFPFQLARPEILEMTADAMKHKIFDELGILPRRPGVDPVVVGRITLKGRNKRWNRKSVNFMVAWFIDLRDI